MGGAILIRTARPKAPLEVSASTSITFDAPDRPANVYYITGLGLKRPLFYGKTVFQYRDTDHFRLPDSFIPAPNNPPKGGRAPLVNLKRYEVHHPCRLDAP